MFGCVGEVLCFYGCSGSVLAVWTSSLQMMRFVSVTNGCCVGETNLLIGRSAIDQMLQ